MEDQLHNALHMVLFVCYMGSVLGDEKQGVSCNFSPFLDRRPHYQFQEDGNTAVNGICADESGKYSKQICLPHSLDHSGSWKAENVMTPHGKSPTDKHDGNKSKATSHSKVDMKKSNNSKKLKGSKRQRKKEKKKKIGKKRKKS